MLAENQNKTLSGRTEESAVMFDGFSDTMEFERLVETSTITFLIVSARFRLLIDFHIDIEDSSEKVEC
jgi:hypothetical protein